MNRLMRVLSRALFSVLLVCGSGATLFAQGQGTLSGQVLDTLGARVTSAKVTLSRDGTPAGEGSSGSNGAFTFQNLAPGRYQVTASAQGFEARSSAPVYVGA